MVDAETLALMIPISAIVLGIGSGVVQSVLKSQERRMEMRLNAQQGQNEGVTQQLKALRAEIAALRDTTTQYDMTNDQIVQRLEERLSRFETRTVARSIPQAEEEQVQRLNTR